MKEREILLQAMHDMRIRGKDSEGHSAEGDFLAYYYQSGDEEQRKQDTPDDMFLKACDWWMKNGHKYL
jgi:hypothetical protein